MKPAFLFPHWFRYPGWGLVLLHIPIAAMDHKNNSMGVNTGLFAGEHLFFVTTTLLMSLGLFFIAFAREKIEDEQIWQLRVPLLFFILRFRWRTGN